MTSPMTVHAIKLVFSQITCSGCGINRIRGIECADCGKRPEAWEINTASLARRHAAIRAQAIMSQPASLPTSGPIDPIEFLSSDVFEHLIEWLEFFLRAVGVAAEGDARDLESSVSEFVSLRAKVHATDGRRPLCALVKVLRSLVNELESMVDAYLAALLATSPLRAQNLARIAQEHLDRTGALARQAGSILETLTAIISQRDVAQSQADLLNRALREYQVSDMLALDNVGRDALQRLVASRGVPGSGVIFAMHDVWARSVLDSERFQSVFRRAYSLFRSNPIILQTLASTPSFEEDFKRAICELFDGSQEAAHAIDNAVHTRQVGRALLGVAAALVEGPGQVMATALLLACGRKTAAYENLRHANATELVNTAQAEHALHGLLNGLDSGLRTGRAHALVRYEQDFAVIERRSETRRVAWADVLDCVFEGQESILACQVALLQALGELGSSNFALHGIWTSMGLTGERVTTFVLETMNCRDVTITSSGNQWDITINAGSDVPLQMLIAMLLPVLPEEVEMLTVTAHQNDEAHVLAGPIAPWREWSNETEENNERQLIFLRAQLSWTYDRSPWLPAPFLRSWVARQAAKDFEAAPPVAVAKLRELRNLAVFASDSRLSWALAGAIRYIRLGSDSSATAELTQLVAWGNTTATLPAWWTAPPAIF